jgi:hypothetical protein
VRATTAPARLAAPLREAAPPRGGIAMTQIPQVPDTPPPDDSDEPAVPEDRPPTPPDEDRAPTRERSGPIMEAPGAETGTSMEAASWNPARGDHSFGYGAGTIGGAPSGNASATVATPAQASGSAEPAPPDAADEAAP